MSLAGCYNAAVKICQLLGGGTPGGPGIGTIIMPLISSFEDAVEGGQPAETPETQIASTNTNIMRPGSGTGFG